MTRWLEMTVRFAGSGSERRPVALVLKRPRWGARVVVRVEQECLLTRSAYLLTRVGAEIVLVASLQEEQAEAARRALGAKSAAYRVVKVEVLDEERVSESTLAPRALQRRLADRLAVKG